MKTSDVMKSAYGAPALTKENFKTHKPKTLFVDTVLEEIFRHLSAKDIKNCALVCSSWNDVIDSTQTTLEKFKLRITKNKTITNVRRRHRTLHIHRNRLTGRVGEIDGVQIDVSNVRFLSYEVLMASWNMEELVSLLRQTPLLEQLCVNMISTHIDISDVAPVTLPRLTSLNVNETLLKYIIAPQLVEFICRGSTEDCTTIVKFMRIHKRIAKVETSAVVFMKILEHDLDDIRLTSLVIDKCLYTPTQSEKAEANFIKMLLNSSDTLTSLNVCTSLISNKVWSVIFDLKKLRTLRLVGMRPRPLLTQLPSPLSAADWPNMTSESLRELIVEHCDPLSILSNTPNITFLSIHKCDDAILNKIATCNKQLDTLRMLSLKSCSVADGVTFDNLKTLVCFFGATDNFNRLKTHCPRLKNVYFETFLIK